MNSLFVHHKLFKKTIEINILWTITTSILKMFKNHGVLIDLMVFDPFLVGLSSRRPGGSAPCVKLCVNERKLFNIDSFYNSSS
jgi:hypothetical protein